MGSVDRRGRLEAGPFSYRALKAGQVFIYYEGRHVTTLSGAQATRFLARAQGGERAAQLAMAKATGNFKHGNEKPGG